MSTESKTCTGCGATLSLCPRCAASEAYRLVDHTQRANELLTKCVHEEVDPMAYGSACADRDVALALLHQERRKTERLEAQVAERVIEADVLSGRACQTEQKEGKGPCGGCQWCLRERVLTLEAALMHVSRVLHKDMTTQELADLDQFTVCAVLGSAKAAEEDYEKVRQLMGRAYPL